MDLTIQMKSAELLANFLRHDTEKIPLYGFKLQKERFSPKVNSAPLPRSTPEAEGVPSAALKQFYKAIEAEADTTACHALTVLRHGRIIAQAAYAPYKAEIPHMLYSMSKSITGLAVGIACDEGRLAVTDKLIDIFPEYVTSANAKILKEHTIWHLLTMSSGIRFNEVGSALDENWVKMFMQSIPKFEAGTAFEYNSLNSYMLAAAVARRTGMGLNEYLTPRLFEPLGIRYHEWEKCPMGIEKGGWGLALTIEDAAKIGQLCLNKGVWNGQRIVSEAWINAATAKQMPTPNGEMDKGYGYQIWLSDNEGAYQFNGAFGQYVLVFPKHDTVIAIFSGSSNLFANGSIGRNVKELLASFAPGPLAQDAAAQQELAATLAALEYCPKAAGLYRADADEFERIAYRLHGREYIAGQNTGGLYPQTLQAVHGNMTKSFSMLRFEKRGPDIMLYIYENAERNALLLRHDGAFEYGAATLRTERQLTATRCRWALEPGRIRLCVTVCFIETPNTRLLRIDITPHGMQVTFDERPALDKTVQMLFELVGVSRQAFYRRLLPLLQRDELLQLVKRVTEPVAQCTPIKQNDTEPMPRLDADNARS